ncbi:hypothetical protein [Streptomyces sp. NPDC101115]|uniref:hypothetical protein n=1 Tax=Streptomyces sp. NPDC101115 TaxID=3366106 RepID=UPI003802A9F5
MIRIITARALHALQAERDEANEAAETYSADANEWYVKYTEASTRIDDLVDQLAKARAEHAKRTGELHTLIRHQAGQLTAVRADHVTALRNTETLHAVIKATADERDTARAALAEARGETSEPDGIGVRTGNAERIAAERLILAVADLNSGDALESAAVRTLTPNEHDRAWHAIEGGVGEDGADPGTILAAVLHALNINAPTVEDEQAASPRRRMAAAEHADPWPTEPHGVGLPTLATESAAARLDTDTDR